MTTTEQATQPSTGMSDAPTFMTPVAPVAPATPVAPAAPAALPAVSAQPDLETRIATRKLKLVDELARIQVVGEDGAVEDRDRIKAQLSELAHLVKQGVVDGWVNVGEASRDKLDRWLAK